MVAKGGLTVKDTVIVSLFFCLHCCLINDIFDYPDSRLSGLFTEVPTSPDNQGSTVEPS